MRGLSVMIVAALVPAFAGLASCKKAEPESPRVMRAIEPYELTAATGQPFGSKNLAGEPYVVNFFFSSCATVCPPIMMEMKAIQDELEARSIPARLVSVTVDPETDTPGRLTQYAEELGASPERWHFLTGAYDHVKAIVIKNLMTHMGEAETTPGGLVDIGHGSHALVIDGKGQLRGVHEPTPEQRSDLLDTLELLSSEGP